MSFTISNSHSYWSSINSHISTHLHHSIPAPSHLPPAVFLPFCHLAFSSPSSSSAAPALCVAACELVGGDPRDALPTASALRLMLAAVYAHDHLPLTDRPRPFTRGPGVPHEFPPNIELLTGDGILPFGYELLARSNDPNGDNSGRVLRVIAEVARAMGTNGVIEGQYREVECTGSDGGELCDEGWTQHMYEKKEGEMHACGAACGAIIGGGQEEEIERLRKFGLYVGEVHGMLHGVACNDKDVSKRVNEMEQLALEELRGFTGPNIEAMSSIFTSFLGCLTS